MRAVEPEEPQSINDGGSSSARCALPRVSCMSTTPRSMAPPVCAGAAWRQSAESRLRGDLSVLGGRLGLGSSRLRFRLAGASADVAHLDDSRLAVAVLPARLQLEVLRLAGHVQNGD